MEKIGSKLQTQPLNFVLTQSQSEAFIAAMAQGFAAGAGLPNTLPGIPDLSTVVRAKPVNPTLLPPRAPNTWSSWFREDFDLEDEDVAVEGEPRSLEPEAEPGSREANEGSFCLGSVKSFLATVLKPKSKRSTSLDVELQPLVPIVSAQPSDRESMEMLQPTDAAVTRSSESLPSQSRSTPPRRDSFLERSDVSHHPWGAANDLYFVAGRQRTQVIDGQLVKPVRAADVDFPVVRREVPRIIPYDAALDVPVPLSDSEDESETWDEISLTSPQLPPVDFTNNWARGATS